TPGPIFPRSSAPVSSPSTAVRRRRH
ncbi:Stage V sporulation protein SpoVM, partial [Dysosmobacter welbionis]